MPLSILIAPDKFKGTLTAQEAAEAICKGWRKTRPRDSFHLLPMSDGGDGFGEVLNALLGGRVQTVATVDAAHRPISGRWWWEPATRTAIVESAAIIGLAQLPPGQFHPFELDTLGLAAVLQAAARKGARRCVVGIGGSATNDGGFGLARGLGWVFLDRTGRAIERWTDLTRLDRIEPPPRRRLIGQMLVAVDVRNPLLGARGATRIYGPQKGMRPQDFALAERCLGRLAKVTAARCGGDRAREPGAGAAGGLGFGLRAFLGARLEPGFDLFARYAALPRRLRAADVVVTGEGAIDASTLMGKGVGELARRCHCAQVPCIGLAGCLGPSPVAKRAFTLLRGLTELTSVEQAKARPAFWLKHLAAIVAKEGSQQGADSADRRGGAVLLGVKENSVAITVLSEPSSSCS